MSANLEQMSHVPLPSFKTWEVLFLTFISPCFFHYSLHLGLKNHFLTRFLLRNLLISKKSSKFAGKFVSIMKKITIAFISLLAFVMASCNGVSPETANAFKGEYWMETSTVGMYQGKEIDEVRTKWSPVSIYEENGKLLVETNWYGAPYAGGKRTRNPYVEEYRERPDFIAQHRISSNQQENGDNEEGIENVEITNGEPFTVIMNGFLYTIKNGAYIKSEPIVVKSGSSTVLELEDFKPVKVTITDTEGTSLAEISVKYDYGKMIKKGDEITWQVDLDLSNMPQSENFANIDRVVHKNTLYKK